MITEKLTNLMIYKHGHFLEFVHTVLVEYRKRCLDAEGNIYRLLCDEVFFVPAQNNTKDCMMKFNTGYCKRWVLRITDVMKSIMASPAYFPPNEVFVRI